jgi:hypothetical protein
MEILLIDFGIWLRILVASLGPGAFLEKHHNLIIEFISSTDNDDRVSKFIEFFCWADLDLIAPPFTRAIFVDWTLTPVPNILP